MVWPLPLEDADGLTALGRALRAWKAPSFRAVSWGGLRGRQVQAGGV